MHRKELEKTITSLEAVDKVKQNTDYQYKWFAVKGKDGCIFEIGGRNYNNYLELKASIPKFDDAGEPEFYPQNDMLTTNFSIVSGSHIHANDGTAVGYDRFIELIQKDVRKFTRHTEYKEEVRVVAQTFLKF